MSAQQSSTVAETQNLSDAQLLAKFQQRCRHLNEALEAERAKTSKLRRYISQLNAKAAPPAEYHQEQPGLQSLVSEQAKLIEQLYAENQQLHAQNQQLQEVTKARTTQNQQLLTANEKLKACIIGLRRQIREYAERQLASKPAPRPVAPTPAPAPVAAPVAAVTPEPAQQPARSWLPTSVGRLLHK
jgi:hypothetical protein